jgi:hypothetical protein
LSTTSSSIGGAGFVSTLLTPKVAIPLELIPGLTLRKATEDEIYEISSELRRYGRQGTFLDGSHLYEGEWTWQPDGKAANFQILPKDRWRYFVLEYQDDGRSLIDARRSFVLTEPELDVPIVVHPLMVSTVMRRISLVGDLSAILGHPVLNFQVPREFSQHDVDAARSVHADLQSLPQQYESIHRAVDLLVEMRSLRDSSPFRVLAMFAVLELLLTHNPGGKELGDSLTHQLCTKIPLVSKRLPVELPYDRFFGSINEASLWKGLYSYRSALAHGSTPTFRNEQAVLKNAENALGFLSTATRAVARHALHEPQLFTDLKTI